jgi:hypothetical protein
MHVQSGLPLEHLDRLTDSTGLIQHAIYSLPRRESGYTTDDNARALRLCARLWSERPDERMLGRVARYLSFLEHARCPVRGFHNFLSYQRDWLDAAGTGDCQGQAVLALAEVLASPLPDGYRALARELIDAVLPALADPRSLRAQAYVIQAWALLWRAGVDDIGPLENVARLAAERMVTRGTTTSPLPEPFGGGVGPSCSRTTVIGRPSFQAIYSTKRVLPQPVGPLSNTGMRCL